MGDLKAWGRGAVSKIGIHLSSIWSTAASACCKRILRRESQWLWSFCLRCRPKWHDARSAGQLAQLCKWELRFLLALRSFFDIQNGIIKLESIRAQDLLQYSCNESWNIWTTLRSQIKIHGDILDMQRGPADEGYCICVHYTNKVAFEFF